jgi:hypothetical protein
MKKQIGRTLAGIATLAREGIQKPNQVSAQEQGNILARLKSI